MAKGRDLQGTPTICDDDLMLIMWTQDGVPALTVEQPEEGMTVLREEATTVKVDSSHKLRT
jgi:hypothetical protein